MLSKASNIDKNHPSILEDSKIRMHASVCAERRALAGISDARGATLFVARVRKNGSLGISRPCDRCVSAMNEAGINKVVYIP